MFRWGILGPGRIAHAFAAGLGEAEKAVLVAVGSRDRARAEDFAKRHGAPHAFGSYAELAAHSGIDAVYVATPHSEHERHAVMCLEAGKHVLCEKPLAINAAQGERMFAAARAHGRVLMEAMWTRFLPAVAHVRGLLALGAIGDVRLVQADFGFRAGFDPAGRLFAPELAGGALLDLGVYPLHLARMICGDPVEIHATANLGATGVDEEDVILLHHAEGRLAVLSCALRIETLGEAHLFGTQGRITIGRPWWGASRVTLHDAGGDRTEWEFPLRGGGYNYEAEAFIAAVQEGAEAPEALAPEDSLSVLRTMDAIRAQWGLRYPGEDSGSG